MTIKIPPIKKNLIFDNALTGIFISGVGTDWNVIAGNDIGITRFGDSALGNKNYGIAIFDGPKNNRIGSNGSGQNDDY